MAQVVSAWRHWQSEDAVISVRSKSQELKGLIQVGLTLESISDQAGLAVTLLKMLMFSRFTFTILMN